MHRASCAGRSEPTNAVYHLLELRQAALHRAMRDVDNSAPTLAIQVAVRISGRGAGFPDGPSRLSRRHAARLTPSSFAFPCAAGRVHRAAASGMRVAEAGIESRRKSSMKKHAHVLSLKVPPHRERASM